MTDVDALAVLLLMGSLDTLPHDWRRRGPATRRLAHSVELTPDCWGGRCVAGRLRDVLRYERARGATC